VIVPRSLRRGIVSTLRHTESMTFGQQSGPPASAKDLQRLLSLLNDAGFDSFREARGPMGFTQRQGSGKFTRQEAAELIELLEAEALGQTSAEETGAEQTGGEEAGPAPTLVERPHARSSRTVEKPSSIEVALKRVSSDKLAAELQRRGWIVMEP
jgi:hypothetical protein